MWPPCASMIERLIDSPIPIPFGFFVTNGSKILSPSFGSSPTPEFLHLDTNAVRPIELRSNQQLPRPIDDRDHRLDAIHDQVLHYRCKRTRSPMTGRHPAAN